MKKVFGISLTLVILAVLLAGCSNGVVTITLPPTGSSTTAVSSAPATTNSTLAGLLAKAAAIPYYYCQINTISTTVTTGTTTITNNQAISEWVQTGSPPKLRMEIAVPGQGTNVMIYDGQTYYMYNPTSKVAFTVSAAAAQAYSSNYSDPSTIAQYSPGLFSSSQTVSGLDCDVFQYKVQGVSTMMWISKQYGLPVEVSFGGTTITYSNFTFSAIDASMFQLPSGLITITPGI